MRNRKTTLYLPPKIPVAVPGHPIPVRPLCRSYGEGTDHWWTEFHTGTRPTNWTNVESKEPTFYPQDYGAPECPPGTHRRLTTNFTWDLQTSRSFDDSLIRRGAARPSVVRPVRRVRSPGPSSDSYGPSRFAVGKWRGHSGRSSSKK